MRDESTYRDLWEATPAAMVVVSEAGTVVVANIQAETWFHYGRNELLGKPVESIMAGLGGTLQVARQLSSGESLAHPLGSAIPLLGRRKDGGDFSIEVTLSRLTSSDRLLITITIPDSEAPEKTAARGALGRILVEPIIDPVRLDGGNYDEGSTAHLAKLDEMHREELAAQQRAHAKDISERSDLEDRARVVTERFAHGVRERTAAAADAKLADANAAAEQSESSFSLLVNGVKDYGIYMLDPLGNVTSWNTGAEHIKGYTAKEIVGKPFSLFYPDADVKDGRPQAHLATAARTGRCEDEGWRVRKDGSAFWASGVLTPIHNASGVLIGFAKIAHDLTERRHLQDQLHQSQKLEAVGSLAGGVAHDFNNLLSVILSYSEILAEELPADAPLREYVEDIRGAGLRAVDLTKQLLAFSRQQVLQPRIVDLAKIVEGMEKMLRRLIGEDIELIAVYPQTMGKILVDPGQMEQVIMNLAVNARDAMPQGGQLTIEMTEVVIDEDFASEHVGAKPGRHVMLAVSDNGIGMTKATQARLFEPFFTTKEAGKGTGLGLATVFGIVRQSGGTIWVYSELGNGTVFKVYLPLSEAAELGAAAALPLDSRSLRGTETILLVDDDERVRGLARTILRKYGYNVLEAQGGGDALLLCEQHPATIHLLLTDVVMPRMSGRQLAERLLVVRPDMKVLYMSGYTDDAVVRHGILYATIAFIQKPITPTALAHKVRETLGPPAAGPAAS
jgi:two-component system cell cycle sensor histidine kinase/response regulator CckA